MANKVAYMNTLIFTIITGIISLAVLSLLFFDFGKKFIWFILTFEIGVFLVIALCIYSIVQAEKKKPENIIIQLNQCPDYYTRVVGQSNIEYCMNWYTVKDMYGNNYVARLYPLKDGANNTITPLTSFSSNAITTPTSTSVRYDSFPLYGLQNDTVLKTTQDRCMAVSGQLPISYSNTTYKDIPTVPWTYARSRCASFS